MNICPDAGRREHLHGSQLAILVRHTLLATADRFARLARYTGSQTRMDPKITAAYQSI
jgi:hypothetical protein